MTWTQDRLTEHYTQQIKQWTEHGIKAKGKEELLKHFQGDRLTKGDAIKAMCYQCMGGYGDGEDRDCSNPPCPLYPYHTYNKDRIKTGKGNTEALAIARASRGDRRAAMIKS